MTKIQFSLLTDTEREAWNRTEAILKDWAREEWTKSPEDSENITGEEWSKQRIALTEIAMEREAVYAANNPEEFFCKIREQIEAISKEEFEAFNAEALKNLARFELEPRGDQQQNERIAETLQRINAELSKQRERYANNRANFKRFIYTGVASDLVFLPQEQEKEIEKIVKEKIACYAPKEYSKRAPEGENESKIATGLLPVAVSEIVDTRKIYDPASVGANKKKYSHSSKVIIDTVFIDEEAARRYVAPVNKKLLAVVAAPFKLEQAETIKKLHLFILKEISEQALDKWTQTKGEICFEIEKLTEYGLFKDTKSAYRLLGSDLFFIFLRSIAFKIADSPEELENSGEVRYIPVYNNIKIEKGVVYISLEKNENWQILLKQFVPAPKFLFSLSGKAFNLLFEALRIANRNRAALIKDQCFTISMEATRDYMKLPKPEETRKKTEYIRKPIEEACEEINAAAKKYNNGEINLQPHFNTRAKANNMLQGSYIKVHISGSLLERTTQPQIELEKQKAEKKARKAAARKEAIRAAAKGKEEAKIEAERAENQ